MGYFFTLTFFFSYGLPGQPADDDIIAFLFMRKGTVRTVLDHSSFFLLQIFRLPRTVFRQIKRTVAKQAVHVLDSAVTWIVLAVTIGKKTIRILHFSLLPQASASGSIFPQERP